MSRWLPVLLFVLCLAAAPGGWARTLRVVTTPDVAADYERLLAGRAPLAIQQFSGPGARRDVVELILVQQALAYGGETSAVQIITAPTYRRMLALVSDGHADLTGNTVWSTDIDTQADRLQGSTALVGDGEFVAGFYRAPAAKALDARIRGGHWHGLTAVSSRSWTPDWRALQRLGLDTVYDVAEWPAMVRMVAAGRADFLLAPLPGDGGGDITLDGVRLVPVTGTCLALAGSRHLALARNPEGDRLRAALDRGLARLRNEGLLRRAYTQSGFLQPGRPHCHAEN